MKRRRRGCCDERLALICIAFGIGVILALFFSLKLVVILAAAFLVVLGLAASNC